jgi:hypothetical protein
MNACIFRKMRVVRLSENSWQESAFVNIRSRPELRRGEGGRGKRARRGRRKNRRARRQDGLFRLPRTTAEGYDARRRRTGRFAGSGCASDLRGAFASAFRSRLALRVSTRSVVAGRASTSTRSIS